MTARGFLLMMATSVCPEIISLHVRSSLGEKPLTTRVDGVMRESLGVGSGRRHGKGDVFTKSFQGDTTVSDLPDALAPFKDVDVSSFDLLIDDAGLVQGDPTDHVPLRLYERLLALPHDDRVGDRVLGVGQLSEMRNDPVGELMRVPIEELVVVGGIVPVARLEKLDIAAIRSPSVVVEDRVDGFTSLQFFDPALKLRDQGGFG